jgi:hypothetical protein
MHCLKNITYLPCAAIEAAESHIGQSEDYVLQAAAELDHMQIFLMA